MIPFIISDKNCHNRVLHPYNLQTLENAIKGICATITDVFNTAADVTNTRKFYKPLNYHILMGYQSTYAYIYICKMLHSLKTWLSAALLRGRPCFDQL